MKRKLTRLFFAISILSIVLFMVVSTVACFSGGGQGAYCTNPDEIFAIFGLAILSSITTGISFVTGRVLRYFSVSEAERAEHRGQYIIRTIVIALVIAMIPLVYAYTLYSLFEYLLLDPLIIM